MNISAWVCFVSFYSNPIKCRSASKCFRVGYSLISINICWGRCGCCAFPPQIFYANLGIWTCNLLNLPSHLLEHSATIEVTHTRWCLLDKTGVLQEKGKGSPHTLCIVSLFRKKTLSPWMFTPLSLFSIKTRSFHLVLMKPEKGTA